MFPPGCPAPARSLAFRPLWSLAGPALGALLTAALLTAPIGPLGSVIQYEFGLSTAAVTLSVVATYVVAAATLVAPGYLLGRRWPAATAVSALMLMAIGSVVTAFAPGVALIAVGRVVAGLGAGTVVGVVLALSDQLGRWCSQVRLVLGLAAGAALLLGSVGSGMVTMMLGSRLVFLFVAPVAAIALAATVVSSIAMAVQRASRPSPPAAPVTTTPLPGETQLGGPTR